MNFPHLLKVSLWIWLVAVLVLGLLLTSCNPYQGLHDSPAATRAAPATSTASIPTAAKTPTPAPMICIVRTGIDAGNLNIRTGAGVASAVITTLSEGQALTITDRDPVGDWIQVMTAAGVIGWINGQYCAVQDAQQ
ncbi:MAG: SH3 domain-containing protein [Chloroflexota bacterium]|nr:SH3 domain-containing protein [Chloroflexota bacterium]